MNITVYLGANEGNDPFFKEAVRELGAWIGTNGNTLVSLNPKPSFLKSTTSAFESSSGVGNV